MSVSAQRLPAPLPPVPVLAVLGVATSLLLTAIGTFIADNGTDYSFGDYAPLLVMVPVFTAVVFAALVRHADADSGGHRALALGLVGVASTLVFWMGLPAVLAAGAAACALKEKDARGSFSRASQLGLGLASVTVLAAVALAFAG